MLLFQNFVLIEILDFNFEVKRKGTKSTRRVTRKREGTYQIEGNAMGEAERRGAHIGKD